MDPESIKNPTLENNTPSPYQQQLTPIPQAPNMPPANKKRVNKKWFMLPILFIIPLLIFFLLYNFTDVGPYIGYYLKVGIVAARLEFSPSKTLESIKYNKYSPIKQTVNGKIAFIKNDNLWFYNPDTKEVTKLTSFDSNKGLGELDYYTINPFAEELVFTRHLPTRINGENEDKTELYYANLENGEVKLISTSISQSKPVFFDKDHVLMNSYKPSSKASGTPIYKIDVKSGEIEELNYGLNVHGSHDLKVNDGKIYVGNDTEFTDPGPLRWVSEIISIKPKTKEKITEASTGDNEAIGDITFDFFKNKLLYVDQDKSTFYIKTDNKISTLSAETKKYNGQSPRIANLTWSPDGKYYAYLHEISDTSSPVWTQQITIRNNKGEKIYEIRPDLFGEWAVRSYSWSPDSNSLVVGTYTEKDHEDNSDFQGQSLWIVSLDGKIKEKIVDNGINPTWTK